MSINNRNDDEKEKKERKELRDSLNKSISNSESESFAGTAVGLKASDTYDKDMNEIKKRQKLEKKIKIELKKGDIIEFPEELKEQEAPMELIKPKSLKEIIAEEKEQDIELRKREIKKYNEIIAGLEERKGILIKLNESNDKQKNLSKNLSSSQHDFDNKVKKLKELKKSRTEINKIGRYPELIRNAKRIERSIQLNEKAKQRISEKVIEIQKAIKKESENTEILTVKSRNLQSNIDKVWDSVIIAKQVENMDFPMGYAPITKRQPISIEGIDKDIKTIREKLEDSKRLLMEVESVNPEALSKQSPKATNLQQKFKNLTDTPPPPASPSSEFSFFDRSGRSSVTSPLSSPKSESGNEPESPKSSKKPKI